MDTLSYYSDIGVPLLRSHLYDAVEILILNMSAERRDALPFKTNRPSRKWLRGFEKRISTSIKFRVPRPQESVLFRFVNVETVTSHFAKLEQIVNENSIDVERIWNLDETGGTPGRDVKGAAARRRYTRSTVVSDLRLPYWVTASRATALACISAAGETALPLFVFKGIKFPYRQVLVDAEVQVESYGTHLPRGAIIAVRNEVGGVDSSSFYSWAVSFVESVRDLTKGGRELLLTYDAYRAHLSLRVLELFKDNGIIVYAIPARTSGKLQPCDVVLFAVFKAALKKKL